MYCPKCGWNNADDATKCANCFAELTSGQPQATQQMPPQQQQPSGQQPYPPQQQYAQPQGLTNIPDNMVWAIVITVLSFFCCCYVPVPVAFGIVAIVKSSQANNKKMMGDFMGALQDSNAARTWIYWAIGLDVVGLIGWILYFSFFAVAMREGMRHTYH